MDGFAWRWPALFYITLPPLRGSTHRLWDGRAAFVHLSHGQRLTESPRKVGTFPGALSVLRLAVWTVRVIWGEGGGQQSPRAPHLSDM